jgi:gephyrin
MRLNSSKNQPLASYVPGKYKVVTPATHQIYLPLPEGCVYRINTGAPLPQGADAVIMVEDTALSITSPEGEEVEIETLTRVNQGENTRQPGSDVKQGDLVLEKGTLLASGGGEIGTLAFVGIREV